MHLLSNNTFTNCWNNPNSFIDKDGTFPTLIVAIVVGCIASIGIDHSLAKYQPEDGFAVENELLDNDVRRRVAYAQGHGFSVDANGLVLCDTEVGLASFSYEKQNASVVFLDIFTASATAELDWSGNPSLDISAVASIYSPSVEFTIPLWLFSITVEGEAYLGGAGIGLEIDSDTGALKITPPFVGIGGTYSVDIDLG